MRKYHIYLLLLGIMVMVSGAQTRAAEDGSVEAQPVSEVQPPSSVFKRWVYWATEECSGCWVDLREGVTFCGDSLISVGENARREREGLPPFEIAIRRRDQGQQRPLLTPKMSRNDNQ
jgi:hypothetical protein